MELLLVHMMESFCLTLCALGTLCCVMFEEVCYSIRADGEMETPNLYSIVHLATFALSRELNAIYYLFHSVIWWGVPGRVPGKLDSAQSSGRQISLRALDSQWSQFELLDMTP